MDWIAVVRGANKALVEIGGLSGLATAIWTVTKERRSKSEADAARIHIRPYGGADDPRGRGQIISFQEAEPSTAYEAKLVVLDGPIMLRAKAETVYDPSQGRPRVINPAPPANRKLTLSLRQYAGHPSGERSAMFDVIDVADAGSNLMVTILTWPANDTVAKRKILLSSRTLQSG